MVLVATLLACARLGVAHAEEAAPADATITSRRPGWTEIVLRDGKRALVPSGDVRAEGARTAVAPPTPRPTPRRQRAAAQIGPAAPAPIEAAPSPGPRDADVDALRAEVRRLRGLVDELTALGVALDRHAETPPAPAAPWWATDALAAIAAALVVGFLVGSAVQRYRARRARSLRF
jgi:hypothetical protein